MLLLDLGKVKLLFIYFGNEKFQKKAFGQKTVGYH